MAEGESYRDGPLAVTATAVETGNRSWALANVARAYTAGASTSASGWAMVGMGIVIVALLAATSGKNAACYAVGGALIVAGAVIAFVGMGARNVMLEMAGGKRLRAWSGSAAAAEAFAEAINAAKAGPAEDAGE